MFGEIKSVDDGRDSVKFSGYLVRFDSIDATGDYFSSQTDFDLSGEVKTGSIYYNHGLDPTVGKRKLGEAEIKLDDVGVWVQGQLNLKNKYDKAIASLLKQGKLGLSSGTAEHLIIREKTAKGNEIKKWPLGLDVSLTVSPAEYQNTANFIKSFEEKEIKMDENEKVDLEVKNDGGSETKLSSENIKSEDFMKMMEGFTSKIDALLDHVSKPTKTMAGYVTETGGKSDKNIKSFGDFLISVKRGDDVRLKSHYGSTKDMTIDTGSTGGYMVPTEMATSLLQIAYSGSSIMQKVTKVPVKTTSGTWPALDLSSVPTAGSGETSMAAGVTSAITAPGGASSETTPAIDQLMWTVNKVSGFTQVQKELNMDSPIAIETLLKTLFGIAIASKNERNILRGSGVGEPLGILNSAALVNVTPATNNSFTYTDALAMLAKLRVINKNNVMWLFHPSVWGDIGTLNNGTFGVWQPDSRAGVGQTILGYQIEQSEHLPQADASGDIVLADLSAYLFFEREQLVIDYSSHYAFINGLDTWLFYQRNDGRPWLKAPITLAGPGSAFTQSCFVNHND